MAFNTWEGEVCDLGGLWFQTDNRGVCLGMGRACAALLGGAPRDFLAAPLQLSDDGGKPITADAWKKAVEHGEVFRSVFAIGAEGFSRAAYDLTVLGWHDPQGVITGYAGSFSPQLQTETKPQVFEQVFSVLETLLRDVPHAIYWKDRDLGYRGASTFFAWCAGHNSPHELIGKRDIDLAWTEEQAEAFEDRDRQVIESAEPIFHVSELQRRGSGEQVRIMSHRVPLYTTDGSVVGVLGVQQEIGEAALADESESAILLERMLSTARLGYWEWDLAANRITFSSHCALALGYSNDELEGTASLLEMLLHPEDRENFVNAVENHFQGHMDEYAVEVRLLSKNDGWKFYRSSGKVVEAGEDGTPSRMISALVDINEVVEKSSAREGALQAQLAKASANSGLTSALLSRVSHAVRTSVDGIMGMATLLDETQLNTEQKEYVHGVHRSAESLVAFIEESLDVVRLESGQFSVRESTFVLEEVLLHSLSLLQPALVDRQVDFCCTIEPDVEERYRGDKERIQRLMLSLCGNALWLMDRGEQGTLTVSRGRVDGDQEHLMFRISHQARATEPRSRQRRPQVGGSAVEETQSWLRSSVAHRLLLALGGTLSVGDTPEILLSFTIPMRMFHNLPVGADDWIRVGVNGPKVGEENQARVLLVEDNAVSQKACKRMLEKLGFAVSVAEDGHEALELLSEAQRSFSLVLLDCDLPRISGFEVTKFVRENERTTGDHLPIVALTGQSQKEERERCFEVGMDEYLLKPVSLDSLRRTVQRYIRKAISADEGQIAMEAQ